MQHGVRDEAQWGLHAAVRGLVGGRQDHRGRDLEADGPVAAEMIPLHFSELPARTDRRGGPRSLRQGDIGQARAWEHDYAGAGRNGSRTPPILEVSLPGVPYASPVTHPATAQVLLGTVMKSGDGAEARTRNR